MADNKPTDNNPKMLGGVNLKASEYNLSKAEFLNIRNLDFDVPGALQKRPGSTQAIVAAVGGPIQALHEFVKLDGSSAIMAGTDTEIRYLSGASLNLLDTGWSNGQPPDLLTFANKEWIANGAKFKYWTGSSFYDAGLSQQTNTLFGSQNVSDITLGSFSILGATMAAYTGTTAGARAVLVAAYAHVRYDGFFSPVDLMKTARPVSPFSYQKDGILNGSFLAWGGSSGWVNSPALGNNVGITLTGFTASLGTAQGVTALGLFFAMDTWTGITATLLQTASLGFTGDPAAISPRLSDVPRLIDTFGLSNYLRSDADLSRFKLFTLMSLGSTSTVLNGITLPWPDLSAQLPTAKILSFSIFSSFLPKYIEINQNSMFMAGFSNAPSNVVFSELGEPENIQPENFFEVRTNDGDRVFAIKAFNNEVIVLKQTSFHKVIGDSPENFALIELSGEYGCISNQSVVEYKEKLCWLDQKGIVQYNGASWDIISNQVEDIFRRMNLDAAKEKACAVHQLYRNQIWWGIPIDGATQNNITVVYDYLVDAWTFFDGFSPASFALAKSALTRPTVFRGDYSGMLHFHGESFFSDNGTAFSCIVTPHWDKNKENETWIWRRAFLDVATVSGLTGQITGKVYSNYDLSTVRATFSTFQDAFQSRAEMGVVGKAVTAEFAHRSASLPLLINNYSWAKRFLRNV